MRPSLRDIQLVEAYLSDTLPPHEKEIFQQRLLLEDQLAENFRQQRKVYQMIRLRGRKQLRRELDLLHHQLFSTKGDRNWQKKILAFFK